MKFHKSRLQNLEEKRSLRQAIFFFLLTLTLLLVIFFVGLPLVIKFSIFLGNRQSPGQYTDTSQLNTPIQPRLAPLAQATNSAVLSINGSAPAGMKVKIFLNDDLLKEVVADKDGEFLLNKVTLNEGKNIIKAISLVNDRESEPALSTIILKKNPPILEVKQPANNANFYDEEKEITIEGVTDPQTTILINEHLAIVDDEGNFSLRLSLKEGENEFNIIAQDDAGNQTKTQLKVTYSP